MRAVFVIFFTVISTMLFADWILENPGQVIVYYDGKEIRMALALCIFVVFACAVLFYASIALFIKAIRIPSSYRRWRRWSARETFVRGYLAAATGEPEAAERLYLRGAKYAVAPEAHYIAAAEMAHSMKETRRRDSYLKVAQKSFGSKSSVLIKQAEWLLEDGRYEEAEAALKKLPSRMVLHRSVLKTKAEIYDKTNAHEEIISLLPILSRRHILNSKYLEQLQISAYTGFLGNSSKTNDLEKIRESWKTIPKKIRNHPPILAGYVKVLFRVRQYAQAEKILRKRIEQEWDANLVALYGEIITDKPERILKKLESWAVDHEDDPGVGIARARQCMQAGLWGQARTMINDLLKNNASPTLYNLLADVDERLGDKKRSLSNRRAGLDLATAKPGDALYRLEKQSNNQN